MSTNQDVDTFIAETVERVLSLPAIRRGEVLEAIRSKVVSATHHTFDQAQRQADELKQALVGLGIEFEEIPTRRL